MKGFRVRVIFYAEPSDSESSPAKCIPNEKSSGSCWSTPSQIDQRETGTKGFSHISLPLRGPEAVEWIQYVDGDGAIWPVQSVAGERDSVVFIDDPWLEDNQTSYQVEEVEQQDLKPKKSRKKTREYTEDSMSDLSLDDGGDTVQHSSVDIAATGGETSTYEICSDGGQTVKVTVEPVTEDSDNFDWVNQKPAKASYRRKETVQRMRSDVTADMMIPSSGRKHRNLAQ
jgi:hypothetical protein